MIKTCAKSIATYDFATKLSSVVDFNFKVGEKLYRLSTNGMLDKKSKRGISF